MSGRDENVWKGLVAGATGGVVGSWAMNQFQALWAKASESLAPHSSTMEQTTSAPTTGHEGRGPEPAPRESEDNATVKAAEAISEAVFDHQLTEREKRVAGPALHYAFGVSVGSLYGATVEMAPRVAAGAGLPFGSFVWLAADELAVPAMGLSRPTTEYPLSVHTYALASHLVYGLTTETVRRAVRRAL
jgi:putative membrane protein